MIQILRLVPPLLMFLLLLFVLLLAGNAPGFLRVGAAHANEAGAATAAARTEAAASKTPLARVGDEVLYVEDLEGAIAFRLFQLDVDRYSLLKAEAEKRIDERLIAKEAARLGLSLEAFKAELEGEAAEVSDAEVEAYLAEHPPDARTTPEQARERVRHYLSQRTRLATRVDRMAALREKAGVRIELAEPVPPRTDIEHTGAPARGPANAPIQIVHFASFGSRHSIRSARKIERLRTDFPGKIRNHHRHFLNDRDESGLRAARISLIADDAGLFWDVYDRLIGSDRPLTPAKMDQAAQTAGLTSSQLMEIERPAPAPEAERLRRIQSDMELAARVGVPREPALFINGRFVSGLLPYDEIKKIVVEELRLASEDD